MKTTFVLWKWASRAYRVSFTAGHVNTLVDMLALHCDEPHDVVCITDDPEGVKCRTYPLWRDLEHLPNPCLPPGSKQYPSCYRRLKIFDPEVTRAMGFEVGTPLVSLDLDCVLLDNIGPLLRMFPDADFTGWLALAGYAWKHPKYFHGSLWRFKAGKLPYVWHDFDPALTPQLGKTMGYFGSDQAWLTMRLEGRFPGWERKHGIVAFNSGLHGIRGRDPPPGTRIVFFNGAHKPWDESVRKRWSWIQQHWPPLVTRPALVQNSLAGANRGTACVPFNYGAQRLRADRMIARYGTSTAKLRRGGSDRPCTVVEIGYLPSNRNRLTNPVQRQILISALAPDGSVLTPAPNQQLDALVMLDPTTSEEEELEIMQPVGRLAPSPTVVFWDLRVRG